MKLVRARTDSGCGVSLPCVFFISHARFFARVRMICIPSLSCTASPGRQPWTPFQYWDVARGILLIVKYLLSLSRVAVSPLLRHTATAAPGLYISKSELE